jgi:hypothetical protein
MDTKTRVFSSGPYMLCGNSHKVGKVDTKTLVVGQDVYMFSGCYVNRGKVVTVTPSGVIVQLALAEGPVRPEGPELIRFDANGKACDSRDVYKGNMEWDGIPGTYECGPWELDDIPFAERTTLLERTWADWKAAIERQARDYKALFERAARAAQGGNYVKTLTLPEFLTYNEINLASRMWEESKHDYANRIAKRIIEPNIARINRAFGQENNPKFPAYIVEYIMEYARKKAQEMK